MSGRRLLPWEARKACLKWHKPTTLFVYQYIDNEQEILTFINSNHEQQLKVVLHRPNAGQSCACSDMSKNRGQ